MVLTDLQLDTVYTPLDTVYTRLILIQYTRHLIQYTRLVLVHMVVMVLQSLQIKPSVKNVRLLGCDDITMHNHCNKARVLCAHADSVGSGEWYFTACVVFFVVFDACVHGLCKGVHSL
jgi:hypothetical protein